MQKLNLFHRKDFQFALSKMVDLGEIDLKKGKRRTGKECCHFLYSHYGILNLRQGHRRALQAAYSVAQWSRSVANHELKDDTQPKGYAQYWPSEDEDDAA